MGQSTTLSMSGGTALLAVLSQVIDGRDNTHQPSPGRRVEHLIDVLKSQKQISPEDNEAIRTLSLARRYFYMAEQYPD